MRRPLVPLLAAVSLVSAAGGYSPAAEAPPRASRSGAPSSVGESPEAMPDAADSLQERLARAELMAGLAPLEGPGLVVVLRHCPRTGLTGVDKQNLLIHDEDINGVLNALRVAGAEALAIGGRTAGREPDPLRVLAGTAAREDRSGVTIGGVAMQAPYRILAIGDARALRMELFREGGVVKRAALEELQMIEVQNARDLHLPPAPLPVSFKFARVRPDAAPPSPRAAPARPVAATPVHPVEPFRTPVHTVEPVRASVPAARPAAPAPAYFGGKTLARYHLPGCRFGERIESADRIYFRTVRDAAALRRVACRYCCGEPGR